jgi:hypothetical protein
MRSRDGTQTPRELEPIPSIELGTSLFVTDGEPSPSESSPESPSQARALVNRETRIEIRVPPVVGKSDYVTLPDEWKVAKVLRELSPSAEGELRYRVQFADDHTAVVSSLPLLPLLPNLNTRATSCSFLRFMLSGLLTNNSLTSV